jgi:hypothetical protein
VGQTTNLIPQIGKKTCPILATENGSTPDVPVAGDEAEADAVAAGEGADINSEQATSIRSRQTLTYRNLN